MYNEIYNPWKAKDVHTKATKDLQRMFTNKITEVKHLNYFIRRHKHKLYSFRIRRERKIFIHSPRITQQMMLNVDGTEGHKIKTRIHPKTWWYRVSTNRRKAQFFKKIQYLYFGNACGTRVLNIRNMRSVKTEKFQF